MALDPIVALEIGTAKVCALVGEPRDDGHIMVTGLGHAASCGVRKGILSDLRAATDCVQKALRDAEQSSRVDIADVYLAVSGDHIRSTINQGSTPISDPRAGVTRDDMTAAMDLARAVNLPYDRELLHSIPRSYLVDDQWAATHPEGMRGAKLTVDMLLVHGACAVLQNAAQAAINAGVAVLDVAFSGLCAAMAVLTPAQKESGVAVIDLGAGATSYLVYARKAIALAGALAVGGDHVTSDIALGFSISPKRAERLKREAGSAAPDSSLHFQQIPIPAEVGFPAGSVSAFDLVTIIRARMDETLTLIAAELQKRGLLDHLGAGLVLTGGGSHLKGIVPLAEQIFNLPCAIGRPINFSGIATAPEGPEYAAPLGLLRYALRSGTGRARKSLLPGFIDRFLGGSR